MFKNSPQLKMWLEKNLLNSLGYVASPKWNSKVFVKHKWTKLWFLLEGLKQKHNWSTSELIHRIRQQIPFDENFSCTMCDGPVTMTKTGYHKYCNNCIRKSEEKIQHTKQTKLERYGSTNYVNPAKAKQTKLERYGDEKFINLEKRYETNIIKYGSKDFLTSEKYKTMLENKEFIQRAVKKCHETKKRNGSYGKSKTEDLVYQLIKVKYPDCIRQYTDARYPFQCDFYIPSQDLFIEYQGYWTHGKEPFNINNIKHLEKYKTWEERSKIKQIKNVPIKKNQYAHAVIIWTSTDILKRETAKNNNINYLELWNFKQVKKWLESKKMRNTCQFCGKEYEWDQVTMHSVPDKKYKYNAEKFCSYNCHRDSKKALRLQNIKSKYGSISAFNNWTFRKMAKKLRDEGFSEEAIQQFKIDQNKKDVEMICEHCGSKYMWDNIRVHKVEGLKKGYDASRFCCYKCFVEHKYQ